MWSRGLRVQLRTHLVPWEVERCGILDIHLLRAAEAEEQVAEVRDRLAEVVIDNETDR